MMQARVFGAEEALQKGLVTRVHPAWAFPSRPALHCFAFFPLPCTRGACLALPAALHPCDVRCRSFRTGTLKTPHLASFGGRRAVQNAGVSCRECCLNPRHCGLPRFWSPKIMTACWALFSQGSIPPNLMMNSMLGAVLAGVAAGAPLVNRWHKQFIARVHPSGVAHGQPLDSES